MPAVRFSRDKRGYEYVYLVHTPVRRGKPGRTRVLYWYRTPPGIRIGRSPFDPDVQKLLEEQNPGVTFDWNTIINTPMPPPDMTEYWRERRRAEKAAKQERRAMEAEEAAEAAKVAGVPESPEAAVPDEPESADEAEPAEEAAALGAEPDGGPAGEDEALASGAEGDTPAGAAARKRRRRRGGRRRKSGASGPGQDPGAESGPSEPPDPTSEGE